MRPISCPSAGRAVTMVTPVANMPNALRNSDVENSGRRGWRMESTNERTSGSRLLLPSYLPVRLRSHRTRACPFCRLPWATPLSLMSLLPTFTIPGSGLTSLNLHDANGGHLSLAPHVETLANASSKVLH